MKTQEQWIREVSDDIKETLIKKNADYGDAFTKRFKKWGIKSAFIRMEDKWCRLENLIEGAEQQVKDESIIDTLKDLNGYITLTIIELLKEKEMNENE